MSPSPILNIVLDNPKPVYSSGDFISGRVILHSQKDEAIGSVTVTFEGRAKTKIHKRNGGNNRTTYRGRGTLFAYRKELYRGHYTLRSDVYEWPFQFQFPELAQVGRRGQDDIFEAKYPFQATMVSHTLPPTFNYSGHGFNTSFKCFTEYQLEAIVTRPDKVFSMAIERSFNLKYLPRRSIEQPDLRLTSHQAFCRAQSLRLLPEKAEEKLTFKEKMHSTFKKSQLPYSSFNVRLSFPTQVYPGGPFPLKIYLCHVDSSPEIPTRPTILLNSVNVEVKTTTFVRTPGLFANHYGDDTYRCNILNRAGLSTALLYSDRSAKEAEARPDIEDPHIDISAMFPFRTGSLCPEFSTYNIAISHQLSIKLNVMCADKDFTVASKCYLSILPPVFGAPDEPLPPVPTHGLTRVVSTQPGPSTAAGPSSEPLPPPPYVPAPSYDDTDHIPVMEKGKQMDSHDDEQRMDGSRQETNGLPTHDQLGNVGTEMPGAQNRRGKNRAE